MKLKSLAFSLAISMLLFASACSSSTESVANDEPAEQEVEIVDAIDKIEDAEEVEAEPEEDEDAAWQEYAYRDLGNLGYATDVLSEASVGDYVTFGSYEQDGNYLDGSEDIEWLVLDIQDGKVLLLSRYGLDLQEYDEYEGTLSSPTWETCSVRAWLNDDFYNEAFTEEEQQHIVYTLNTNPDSNALWLDAGRKDKGASGGNDTEDYVFLLSYQEVYDYFGGRLFGATDENYYESLVCYPTQALLDKWVHYLDSEQYEDYYAEDGYPDTMIGAVAWLLRSPGNSQDYVSIVDYNGTIWNTVANSGYSSATRPAIWVSFE